MKKGCIHSHPFSSYHMCDAPKYMVMAILRGWRYGLVVGGLVGFISAALYPIIIYPLLNVDTYKKIQAETRKDVNQEEIQPGNMKVWSDPFGRKPQ
ncbi:small integral membrane protein 20 [Panulirus ornatus]|uniref:small integral membrane protein 20 n=1 Tax=Panulirus ornatus TaxID=150431 RepID=UPI003A875167